MPEAAAPLPARAVLFVHGAGGGGWEWRVWARVFAAEGLRVRAPDLAPAPAGLAVTQLEDYRLQVRAWAQAIRASEPASEPPGHLTLVGASLGGLLAWTAADLADALVLVNPLPPLPWSRNLPVRKEAFPALRAWRREASLAGTRRSLPDADDAACVLAFRHWCDESGAVLDAAWRGVAAPLPRCPVLVLVSEQDDEIPAEIGAGLAGDLGASLVRIPGASHVGPLLGRSAAAAAAHAVDWLNLPARPG